MTACSRKPSSDNYSAFRPPLFLSIAQRLSQQIAAYEHPDSLAAPAKRHFTVSFWVSPHLYCMLQTTTTARMPFPADAGVTSAPLDSRFPLHR